jgi:predicted nucleic acid-binding protein
MSVVFLDTVGLLALWDKDDQWHATARTAFEALVRERRPMVTTTFVLLECGNAAARRPYRLAVDRLRKQMHDEGTLITPTAEDWDAGWQGYRNGTPTTAGIVDQVSFAVLRRIGIANVFTNDRHFRAAGFEVCF